MMRRTASRLALGVALGALWPAAHLAAGQGPPLRTLTEQEMVDMMVGSSIQASRSSDSASMIRRVQQAFAQGRRFTMVSVEDLPDDWTVITSGAIGGGGAWEHVRERVARQQLPAVPDSQRRSIEALGAYLGRRIDAFVRPESAGATLGAFMIASELGVPVVDACLSGRARPEVAQSVSFINGIPAAPTALVSRWGDTVFLARAVDDHRAEDIQRALAVASGGSIWMAGRAMSGAEVKRATIRGSVSQAIRFGRTVREAVAEGRDPIDALVKISNGYRLFRGLVTRADGRGEGGFTWWDVELTGTHDFEGHVYRVFVKNENIVTWLDGTPDAMAPDFISNLDPGTGDAISGGQGLGAYPMGADVVMVSMAASPMWRTPKGIEVLGPRHFGFDFDYVTIEELQKRRALKPSGR